MKFAFAMGSAALMGGMVLSYATIVSTYGFISLLNTPRPDEIISFKKDA